MILDPKSAPTTPTRPSAPDPKFDNWAKGSAITLVKNDAYRNAAAVKLKKVTFRSSTTRCAGGRNARGRHDGMPRFAPCRA